MGRSLTNNTSLQYAIEQSIGVLPGSPTWKTLEPNTIGTIGAEITTVARNPISKNRQRRKGTIVDLDSTAEFEMDITLSHYLDFVEGFSFASAVGIETYDPSSVSASTDAYTVASGSVLANGTIVYAKGFTQTANNGLKIVNGTATATSISVFQALADEASPPSNATVEVAGFRSLAGDLAVTSVSGTDVTINSTAGIFTNNGLNITVGGWVYFGGANATNKFTNAQNVGYGRVVSVDANDLVIDKTSQTWVTEAAGSQAVDIYCGSYVRNVGVDDADFLERSYQFEIGYENLQNPGPGDEYEYCKGNYCNTLAFSMPLSDKATFSAAFIGTDTDVPTTTRATNASSPIAPVMTSAFNTTQDCARLRITQTDETGLTTDFKSLTVTINNNVSPEKVLCNLGARYMNYGNFEINIEGTVLFTDSDVVDAIRNNTTVTMDFGLRNDDGAFMVDVPSFTLGGGAKDFPVNESINLNLTGEAFADNTLNTSVGFTYFPHVPAS